MQDLKRSLSYWWKRAVHWRARHLTRAHDWKVYDPYVFGLVSTQVGYVRKFKNRDCEVTIGAWTYFAPKPLAEFFGYGTGDRIIIGKFCSIASNATFIVGGNHNLTGTSYPLRWFLNGRVRADVWMHQGDIVVGNDVYIGHGAIILRAQIGDGAVIGAGAVVRGDVPPYSVVIGNPAQVIRYRYTPEQIAKFEEIKWWDWQIQKIRQEAELLTTDVDAFLAKHWHASGDGN